jgi:hypothetical protein
LSGGYVDSKGELSLFTSGQLRQGDLGLLIESGRTNAVAAGTRRDLTQAAWTKTNVTAAKNQTGIDGVANSASSITATSNNGTCLQAITLGSSARYQSAYVKRITGSGTVEMTMDNGSTWTAVTVTSSWTRVTIPTRTLANPTIGFRLGTSGDAIAVDVVQNENGAFPLSPIDDSYNTRNSDLITFSDVSWFGTTEGTLYFNGDRHIEASQGLFEMSDGTANNTIVFITGSGTPGQQRFDVVSGGAAKAQLSYFVDTVDNTNHIIVGTYKSNDFRGCANGGSIVSDASGSVLSGITTATVGKRAAGASLINGKVREVAAWTTALTNPQLRFLTSKHMRFR